MKHLLCFLIVIHIATPFFAQASSIEWQTSLGGTYFEQANTVQQTPDGGYIVSGYAESPDGDVGENYGYWDFWVVKFDSSGAVQWKKIYGGEGLDQPFSIQNTFDGGYVIAGYTDSSTGDVSGWHGDKDAWVLKLDSTGGIQWQKCLGGIGWEEAWDIQQTAEGGYIVAGRSSLVDGDVSGGHGSFDYWVIKLSPVGDLEWEKSYGGSLTDIAYSVQQTKDGGYIVVGETGSNDGDVENNHGSTDYWVVKLDEEGKIEWERCLGGTGPDRANEVHQTREGGYVVVGQCRSSNGDVTGHHGGYDYWVVKLSAAGDIEWQKALGGNGEDYGTTLVQTSDDGYVMTGFAYSNNGDITGYHGSADMWTAKLNAEGALEWQRSLGGSLNDKGHSIKQSRDGGYIIAGESFSTNGDVTENKGYSDFWIVKLSAGSSATAEVQALPLKIFPNPAASSVRLQVPSGQTLTRVAVSDVLGRRVLQQKLENGGEINVSALPSGFYLAAASTKEGLVYVGKLRKE